MSIAAQLPVVILQARTSSSRLPGKALLPVAGEPAAVLAARRAARGGWQVRVATSSDASDDVLAHTLMQAGLAVVRGSLTDVLSRFELATRDLADEDLVFRLTADNLLPDSDFLQQLATVFNPVMHDYLGTHSPLDGLPYGMSAEVFSVGALREAAAFATDASDREHVTPWIRRHARVAPYRYEGAPPHWSRLRCTMDTFADYQAVVCAFDGIEDPVDVCWTDLVARVAQNSPSGTRPRCPWRLRPDSSVHSVLTLGSAQFGLDYGVANAAGRPDDASLSALLTLAVDAGITCIDTARAYGDAERRLGDWFSSRQEGRCQIVTKLSVLTDLPADAPQGWVRAAVEASVMKSLQELRVRRIDTLMLHRWAHREAWHGVAWSHLLSLRDQGLIGTLGVSVSSVQEAISALREPEVGHLQCPVNLLDHRWRSSAWLQAVAARPDVLVHARSVLLQGLLTLPAARWPATTGVAPEQICRQLDELVEVLGRRDRMDLCIAYVRALPWVHSLVVGIDEISQLFDNLALATAPALSDVQLGEIVATLPELPVDLLDPSCWKFARE